MKSETAIGRKLGQKVRELRKKKGITQERLSELTNISYKHIQRIERKPDHAGVVTLINLHSLAKALDVTLPNLLDFKKDYATHKIPYAKAAEKSDID